MIEPDKYDKAVTYLQDNPKEIRSAWFSPYDHEAGCLFMFTGPRSCGCLTTVRAGNPAPTQELTEAIQNDERIPKQHIEIRVKDLDVFAEWQRRLEIERNDLQMAANGCISGTLAEWPVLKRKLRERGFSVPDTVSANTVQQMCKDELSFLKRSANV